jgi:hypothetical protein
LGVELRESGHNRVPVPPASMTGISELSTGPG